MYITITNVRVDLVQRELFHSYVFDAKRFISILNEQHSNIALFLVPTMLHQLLNVDNA
jgi:hypothetical protein